MKRLYILATAIIIAMFSTILNTAAESESKYTSTFIQSWLCRDWSEQRWDAEFSAAKDVGFDSVILQSVIDLTYEQTDTSKSKQNFESYSLSSVYSIYPTALFNCTGNALEKALESAKKNKMKIYIGTVNDNRWWNYGWGIPEKSADSSESYFELWSIENGKLCSDVINEIWNLYGNDYSEQIAGFYYNNEIWNIDTACNGTDDKQYAEIIGNNINYSINAVNMNCSDKSVMISPFFNPDISSSAEYSVFWKDIFKVTGFRAADIFAHQDGAGRELSSEIISEWTNALYDAVLTEKGLHFWINNESFDTNAKSLTIDTLSRNYDATATAERHIIFSWNHYYNDINNPEFTQLNSEFKNFNSQYISGDVNADGEFNIADVVTLQKWLIDESDTKLKNCKSADVSADGQIDVIDLVILKNMILNV